MNLDIQARIEKGGVYPLMIESPINVEMAGNPVEVIVEAGTPFYYIEDKGEIKFSDGTSKITLGSNSSESRYVRSPDRGSSH